MNTPNYLLTSQIILDELDRRGFTVEDSSQVIDLVETIANIIKQTMEGNTQWTIVNNEIDEIDGMEYDLLNQM